MVRRYTLKLWVYPETATMEEHPQGEFVRHEDMEQTIAALEADRDYWRQRAEMQIIERTPRG